MKNDEISLGRAAEFSRHSSVASGQVLQIAPRIYREYAREFAELAHTHETEAQREIYLKAAKMWLDAASTFEFETGYFSSQWEQKSSPLYSDGQKEWKARHGQAS
jgi:hypothetical protein